MSKDIPNWVQAAIDIEGVGVEPRCSSCNQLDLCDHEDTIVRANESIVCDSCERLLEGRPMKEDQFCAQCGRKWVRC
jgi:hypothetical protein